MRTQEADIITGTSEARQQLFKELYLEVFPKMAAFVSKRSGTLEDAQDVFQDALVIFYEKSSEADFAFHTSGEAYLLGTAKHLWYRKFSKDLKHATLDDTDISAAQEEHINDQKVLQLLEETGRKCLNLLHAFYYDKMPVKQISRLLGYSSEHSATVQKYKCLEKVRDTIKEKAIEYAHFID